MELKTTPVSQCLDKRLVLFGFEIIDLILVFLVLSFLNFLFGQSDLKIVLVWVPTLLLAAVLYFGKRGKPENYLIHWMRYQIRPGTYSAFSEPNTPPLRQSKGRQRK